jgi:hypothetical protein
MIVNPGTERAIQTLAEYLPKMERTLEAMTRELKRYNDRVEVHKTGKAEVKLAEYRDKLRAEQPLPLRDGRS